MLIVHFCPKYFQNLFKSGAVLKQLQFRDTFIDTELNTNGVSRWANNSIDSDFIAVWTRQGLEVHFGYHNGYTFPRGEALAQYEDYMERLQQAGYVVVDGTTNKVKRYKITKQGYDFAKTLLDNYQQ